MTGGGSWSGRQVTELRAAVLGAKGTVCHLCGYPGADTIDHLIPRSLGGDNSVDNLAPAHHSCNSARGALPLEAWRARHPISQRAKPSRNW